MSNKDIFIRMIDGGWRIYWPNREDGGEYRDLHDYGGIKDYLLGRKPNSELIGLFKVDDLEDDVTDTPAPGSRGAMV